MIHQVPIRSLPQEWLWCETWCDDESLSTAKAIDLVLYSRFGQFLIKCWTTLVFLYFDMYSGREINFFF